MSDDSRFDSAHTVIAADRYRRSRGLWRLLTFVAFAIAILAIAGRFALIDAPRPGDRIARIVLDGPISTSRDRLQTIEDLRENDAVKAVIVSINSPGGTTAGGEELYEAFLRLRAEKPVVAVINELGASGAYMAAIATDRIYARRLSIVGSIGVLYQHVNAGQLMETIGIDVDKVASGPLKAEPDFDEPLTGAPRQAMEQLVENSFAWFVDIVAEQRGLSHEAALGLSDGRVVSGRTAEEEGLIDALGGEQEAIAWLESEGAVAGDLPVTTAWPLPPEGLGWVAGTVVQQARSALGLPGEGPVLLDGLVSLWQVDGRI